MNFLFNTQYTEKVINSFLLFADEPRFNGVIETRKARNFCNTLIDMINDDPSFNKKALNNFVKMTFKEDGFTDRECSILSDWLNEMILIKSK